MISDETPLGEVKDWLAENMDGGVACPACTQMVKLYRRKITSPMARGLIKQYRVAGREYAHSASVAREETHEFSQLAWWGLVEEHDGRRDDGGRAGWWRISDLGESFVRGEVAVPKYVYVYNKQVHLRDPRRKVYIRDALGTKFDYAELMGATIE